MTEKTGCKEVPGKQTDCWIPKDPDRSSSGVRVESLRRWSVVGFLSLLGSVAVFTNSLLAPDQGGLTLARYSSFDLLIFFTILQINELKRDFQKGGRSVFTWQKGPNDVYVNYFGAFLTIFGVAQLIPGHYRLATGKGKMD